MKALICNLNGLKPLHPNPYYEDRQAEEKAYLSTLTEALVTPGTLERRLIQH
jgi:hypothetical protein